MKFKILFILLFALLAANSFSQIKVTVKDSITAQPIGYATVELLSSADSSLVAGITNDNGFIAIPVQPNTAKIRISFIGYKTFVAPVTALDMGVILMAEDVTQLSEVTVNGSNRTVKIDRDVYVITKDLKAGTATARELLGKLNGVVYNPYDQSLMVNGSTKVLILVDGIEKDQNMAKTLSPDRIDRVEVIKDPVGKYAADGYKAVFNIITKKDFSGIDITANTNPMFNFIDRHGNPSVFIQDNSSLNVLYTYKKLNLYTGYWGNHGKLYIPMTSEKRYGDLFVTTPPMNYKNPNMNAVNNYNAVWLGGDYSLKEGNTLAFDLHYDTYLPEQTNVSDLTTYLNDVVIGRSQSKSFSRNTTDALQTTLTYHGKWSEKSNFEGDFRYRHSTPTNKSVFEQGEMAPSISQNNQIENFYRINLTYTYQFTPKFSMDLGYGAIISHANLYQNNTTLTQHQVRNRPSVYFSYTFSDKLNMKVGAMVEFFDQKFIGLHQAQTGYLPFANIMYKPSDKLSVTAKYRAYPGYPDINSLTTFTTQMDTLTWSVGNSRLQSSNYQEAGLDINFLKYFTVSPFYGFDASNHQQYLYEENGQFFQKPVGANFRKLGMNANFTLPIAKKFFWQNWLQMSETWMSYNGVHNKQFAYMFNSMFIYNMQKWDAMAGAGIQKNITKWATLQGYNTNGNDIPLIMLQKNFFQKKLSCTFIYVPPIKADFIKYSQDELLQTPNYYSFNSAGLKLLNNLMVFQINYHFNAGKQVNVTKSSLDNDSNVKQKSGIL